MAKGLKLSQYKRSEDETVLESVGTALSIAGKGGEIGLIRKNMNSDKRLVLLIKNAKGESTTVSCSEAVTKAFKAGQMKLSQIAQLEILENEEGVHFVSMPATGAIQSFKVADLQKHATPVEDVQAEFVPEDSIW